jgi:translation initiation factor IF-2
MIVEQVPSPRFAPDSGGSKGAPKDEASGDKVRIYVVAKEFSVSSDAMMSILKGLGVEAKSHMSSIDAATVELVRKTFAKEKEAVLQEDARKREVQRASRKRTAAAQAAQAHPPAAPVAPVGSAGPAVEVAAPKPHAPAPIPSGKRRGMPVPKRSVDQKAVQANIKKTMADLETRRRRHKRRTKEEGEEEVAAENVLKLTEFVSTSELAGFLGVSASQLIAKAIEMGSMVTINQRLDRDMIEMLADEFGFGVQFQSELDQEVEGEEEVDREEDLKPRPAVVTIMGHVDHGKTSLLDYIRETRVVAGEAGGITQHIGAYHVELDGGKSITFLDTPGHEAFTAMRARGAQVTDLVVLVVAADDSVMPQTIEAIDHAKAAGVPIVVAVNKIDKPGANPDRVRQELTAHSIVSEEWGGQNIVTDVSAKTGQGVDKLLEMILLQAEVLELKANPDKLARGAVIEARMDRGRGAVVTVLVQEGTLHVGDPMVAGAEAGRVRALQDERGHRQHHAGPSAPVAVLGFSSLPKAGDTFVVTPSDRDAREIAGRRRQLLREQEQRLRKHVTLENFFETIQEGGTQELRVVIKADVEGSAEAVADSVEKISTSEVKLRVLHRAVGSINESDVLLAAASDAIVLGFHVNVEPKAREIVARERVDVRTYDVIYEAIEDIKAAMEGLLKPVIERRVLGSAEVRQVFRIPKQGTIAGSMVLSGLVKRNAKVTVRRGGEVVHEGKISSLKRFKEDVSEVKSGFECGIGVDTFPEIREGDVLEVFEEVEVARRL